MSPDAEPGRKHLMDPRGHEVLAKLPESFTAYRGQKTKSGHRQSFSWTLDPECARWFAQRHAAGMPGKPEVVARTVRKADVVALFLDRSEAEVIITKPPGRLRKPGPPVDLTRLLKPEERWENRHQALEKLMAKAKG